MAGTRGRRDDEPDLGAQTRLGLVLRAAGAIAAAYLALSAAAQSRTGWVVALTVVALLSMLALLALRLRGWDGWSVLAATLAMVSGAVAAPWARGYIPIYFVVAGGVVLLGQQEVRFRVALALVALSTAALLGSALVRGATPLTLIAVAAGLGAVALAGLARRQAQAKDRQDRELVERSRELERRSAELIAQTELTRHETARAAALEERSRIARDIHDVLAHTLGGLVVQLDAADALLDRPDVVGAARRVQASRALAVEGLQEARRAVDQLRGLDGTPVDLVDAVTPLVHGPVGTGVHASLDVVGDCRLVPAPVAQALTAVTREGLTNVNKHAPGGPAKVTLVFDPTSVVLEIGSPRPDAEGELAGTGTGTGLLGMEERLSAVGGSLAAGPHGRRWLVEARCPTVASPEPREPHGD